MQVDKEYKSLIQKVLLFGNTIKSRNGTTKQLRNYMIDFHETPLVSARKTAWKSALREMEWFLSGSNNINDLHPSVQKWWEPWSDEDGFIQNNYGKQLRRFGGSGFKKVDQVKYLIENIKQNPESRRHVITTWNTTDMISPVTPITNCHGSLIIAQVVDNRLHLTMHQRSADLMLGVPHNWIQYWAFLMYLAHQTGLEVGIFTWIGSNIHIYENHLDTARKVVYNEEGSSKVELIYEPTSDEFKASDFSLEGKYKPVLKESLEMNV